MMFRSFHTSEWKASLLYNFKKKATLESPRRRWPRRVAFLSIGGICWYVWDQVRDKSHTESTLPQSRFERFSRCVYVSLPLNTLSRGWGWINSCNLPKPLRYPMLGTYSYVFSCNMDESLESDYRKFANLSEFFRRELRPDSRPIDQKASLVMPADGRVLKLGLVTESGILEQIKGQHHFSIKDFFGPLGHRKEDAEMGPSAYRKRLLKSPNSMLMYGVIYLAPGDCHRFSSPADWVVQYRRHFPGKLLSVNEKILSKLPVLTRNERVVYTGEWVHGFFSYTLVGATNVGSIRIAFDENLVTNDKHVRVPNGFSFDADFTASEDKPAVPGPSEKPPAHPVPSEVYLKKHVWKKAIRKDVSKSTPGVAPQKVEIQINADGLEVHKGDYVGEFNLGSMVVLIFEAPPNFEWTACEGDKTFLGRPLGLTDTDEN